MASFKQVNANYWNRNIGDCTIRALSYGTGIGYLHVMEMLGLKWKLGVGLVKTDGVNMDHIVDIFEKENNLISEVYTDEIYWNFYSGKKMKKDIFIDPEAGDTINEFCEYYRGTGRFILFVRPGRDLNFQGDWHCVYANCINENVFDTWDCRNFIVFGAYKINMDKLDQNDRFSRKSEVEKIKEYMKTKNKKLLKF